MMNLLAATTPSVASTAIPAPPNPTTSNNISVLCFSKDRPFQLKEFLRSFQQHVHNKSGTINITVLYKTAPNSSMACSYNYIRDMFPTVNMMLEKNFTQQLETFVQTSHAQNNSIMFAVDDVFFFNRIELSTVLHAFRSDPTIYAFHSKLHPNISYCHPADKQSIPPRTFQRVVGTDVLVYDRLHSGCTSDWNYPWDLCCTMYRSIDVVTMLAAMKKTKRGMLGLTHPNLFESEGARLMSSSSPESSTLMHGATKCCCLNSIAMVVVTINRVQSIYTNPIYTNNRDSEKKDSEQGDVEFIEECFSQDRQMKLNERYYQNNGTPHPKRNTKTVRRS